MITRRHMFAGAAACLAAPPLRAELGDDGLHKQDWFTDSFLELADDLDTAAAQGRGLMVLFEQAGCPYCRELHEVNFAHPRIVAALREHFDVIQLDLWGAREVMDFDGMVFEERRLASRWGVNFTPTTVLFAAQSGGRESLRLPGYLKPFHYLSALEYVASGAYAKQPFQRYLQDKFSALRAQGIDPDVW